MNIGLKNKTALILAASSGIGKATATEFAKEGANVVIFSRSGEKLKQAQSEIYQASGIRPVIKTGDQTNPENIRCAVKETIDEFGSIHTLVNNCGGPPPGTFDLFDDKAWKHAFDLTLLSYIRSIREVLPHMKKAKMGMI